MEFFQTDLLKICFLPEYGRECYGKEGDVRPTQAEQEWRLSYHPHHQVVSRPHQEAEAKNEEQNEELTFSPFFLHHNLRGKNDRKNSLVRSRPAKRESETQVVPQSSSAKTMAPAPEKHCSQVVAPRGELVGGGPRVS